VATNLTVNITIPTQSDPVPVMSVFSWIIILQHLGFTFNWHLPWADYKAGFGSVDADFWLGLEKMHLLTSSKPYRLRVEVQQDSTNLWFSAEYWSFQIGDGYWSRSVRSVMSTDKIGDEYWSFEIGDELNDKYRLELDGYSGDAGDALRYEGDLNGNGYNGWYFHSGMMFSAYNQDNDQWPTGNCARNKDAGWWHNHCYYGCLTCDGPPNQWRTLPGSDDNDAIVNSRMMIKPQ